MLSYNIWLKGAMRLKDEILLWLMRAMKEKRLIDWDQIDDFNDITINNVGMRWSDQEVYGVQLLDSNNLIFLSPKHNVQRPSQLLS